MRLQDFELQSAGNRESAQTHGVTRLVVFGRLKQQLAVRVANPVALHAERHVALGVPHQDRFHGMVKIGIEG